MCKQSRRKASCIYPERVGPSSWTTLSLNFPIYEISRFDHLSLSSFCHQMLWPCCALTFWSLWPHRITTLLHSFLIPTFIQTMVKTTSLVLAKLPVSKVWHGLVIVHYFTQTSPWHQCANRTLSVLRLREISTVKSLTENAGAQEKWRQTRHNIYSHSGGMWFQ